MRTFTEYRQSKLLEQFLTEMPEMDYRLDKAKANQFKTDYDKRILKYDSATLIPTDKGNIHEADFSSTGRPVKLYFHKHHNGTIGAVSHIINHQQQFVHKGNDNIDIVHSMMKHYIHNHNPLSQDSTNTPGSKKLWTDFVKSSPENIEFHHTHNGNKITKLNKDNIDKESKNIWKDENEGQDHRILATSTKQ